MSIRRRAITQRRLVKIGLVIVLVGISLVPPGPAAFDAQEAAAATGSVVLSGVSGELVRPEVSPNGSWRGLVELKPGFSVNRDFDAFQDSEVATRVSAFWRSSDGETWERVGLPVGYIAYLEDLTGQRWTGYVDTYQRPG